MKNTLKYIIITFVVLVVLGGGITILLMTPPTQTEEEPSSVASATPTTDIITREVDGLERIEITNSLGEMIVNRTPAKEDEYSDTYVFEGYENYDALATVGTSIEKLLTLKSTRDIGEVSDLEEYGLVGDEKVDVKLIFDGEDDIEITIGSQGGSGTGRYVMVDDMVYIASVDDFFQTIVNENVRGFSYNEIMINAETGEQAYSIMTYINFSGSNFPEPVEIVFDEETYDRMMVEPFEIPVDTAIDRLDNMTLELEDYSLNDIAVLNATEEDLEEYGLNNPIVVMEYGINEGEHTLVISEKIENGNRYIIADGDTSTIYQLPAVDLELFTNATLSWLRSGYLYITPIMEVDFLTIDYKDETLEMDFARTINEEKTTEDHTEYDYSVKANGFDVTYKDVTTGFYTAVIAIVTQDVYMLEHDEEPTLEITYDYYDGSQEVVSYYAAGESYVAYLDGHFIGVCRDSSIDTDFQKAYDLYLSEFQ